MANTSLGMFKSLYGSPRTPQYLVDPASLPGPLFQEYRYPDSPGFRGAVQSPPASPALSSTPVQTSQFEHLNSLRGTSQNEHLNNLMPMLPLTKDAMQSAKTAGSSVTSGQATDRFGNFMRSMLKDLRKSQKQTQRESNRTNSPVVPSLADMYTGGLVSRALNLAAPRVQSGISDGLASALSSGSDAWRSAVSAMNSAANSPAVLRSMPFESLRPGPNGEAIPSGMYTRDEVRSAMDQSASTAREAVKRLFSQTPNADARRALEDYANATSTMNVPNRIDNATERLNSNQALQDLQNPMMNTIPTDNQMFGNAPGQGIAGDWQNQARALGRDQNALPLYTRFTSGGRPQLRADGSAPSAEQLGFVSNDPARRRAALEARYGRLPLDQLIARDRADRGLSPPVDPNAPTVDPRTGETIENQSVREAQQAFMNRIRDKKPKDNGGYMDPLRLLEMYGERGGSGLRYDEKTRTIKDQFDRPVSPADMHNRLQSRIYREGMDDKKSAWSRIIANRQAQNAGFANSYQAEMFRDIMMAHANRGRQPLINVQQGGPMQQDQGGFQGVPRVNSNTEPRVAGGLTADQLSRYTSLRDSGASAGAIKAEMQRNGIRDERTQSQIFYHLYPDGSRSARFPGGNPIGVVTNENGDLVPGSWLGSLWRYGYDAITGDPLLPGGGGPSVPRTPVDPRTLSPGGGFVPPASRYGMGAR